MRSKLVAMGLSGCESIGIVLSLQDVDEQAVGVRADWILVEGFNGFRLHLRELGIVTLGEQPFDVIPRALVVRGLGNPSKRRIDLVFQRGALRGMSEDEVAHIPGGVVPQILHQQVVQIRQFLLPQAESFDDPLAIRPCVVVFRVSLDQHSSKLQLSGRIVQLRHKPLSMVPDLIILRILGSQIISVLKIIQ